MEDKTVSMIGSIVVVAGSTLAGLFGYGLYGYLREQKKFSTWGAGAATGALSGLIVVAALYGQSKMGNSNQLFPTASVGSLMDTPIRQIRLKTIPRIVQATAGYTIDRISGCTQCAA